MVRFESNKQTVKTIKMLIIDTYFNTKTKQKNHHKYCTICYFNIISDLLPNTA